MAWLDGSAVKVLLLDRYGQPDPLEGLATGTYKTAAFQALHDAPATETGG